MRFVHFLTKEGFNDAVKRLDYLDNAICFIKDSLEIYTHNTFYPADKVFLKVITSDGGGTISQSELKKDGYRFLNGYGVKDNIIYPLMYINDNTIVGKLSTKSVTAIGGSNLLTYSAIGNCEVYLFFIKI